MADGARQTGAELKFMECETDGTLTDETIQTVINENTKLVAVTQVSNVLGCVNPIEKIVARAHEVGAVVVMDGAQSVPHMPVDVQKLDVDFMAFSGINSWADGNRCIIWQESIARRNAAISYRR